MKDKELKERGFNETLEESIKTLNKTPFKRINFVRSDDKKDVVDSSGSSLIGYFSMTE